MTTEQLAIVVSAVVAVSVTVISVIYQGRVTRKTLDSQAELTRQTLEHERTLARDQRVQERRAETYVQMLEMLDWIMQIVEATQPILEPGPESPPEPDFDTIRPIQARISAFASPEVKSIVYKRWNPTRIEFFLEADNLRGMREREKNLSPGTTTIEALTGKSIGGQYQVVQGLREQLRSVAREIEDQVNDELRR